MAYWLFKTEPSEYTYADLDRDQETVWDGVANNLALKYLRTIAVGDRALIYHTGNERRAVGIAEVTRAPYPDPQSQDTKRVVVDVKPIALLPQPVSLATMKADPEFAGFVLLHNSRLSVVPVAPAYWQRIMDLAEVFVH